MTDLMFAFWFFMPAGLANMAPVFANNISFLSKFDAPIDMGRKLAGKRILGDHKTYRGLLSGVAGGLIGGGLQMLLYANSSWLRNLSDLVDYSEPRVLLIGVALGLGALVGDSFKSFFKRQVGIEPGRGWFPYDQTDFVFGSALFTLPFIVLPLKIYLLALFLALTLHPTANIIGWLLKMKPRPF